MPVHSYSALYYPFIHFKDDRWLKLNALYWDRIGRIVPNDYMPEDSETVKELGNFIEILRPNWVRPEFGETFVEFAQEHGAKLSKLYGVDKVDQWPVVPRAQQPPKAGGLSGTDPRLNYVFYEKMTEDLRNILQQSGIAQTDPFDPRWIGMHPRIAQVYMTALADELAGEYGLYPLTDETLDHLAVGGWTVERLAQALLGDVNIVQDYQESRETESVAACVAIKTILPKDLDSVSIDSILEFREAYPIERANFQNYIRDFVSLRDWLQDIRDRDVLEQRLEAEYQKILLPQLQELKEKLRSVNIDTVTGVLGVQIAVPSIILQGATLLGVVANPIGATLAGAALAIIPVFRDRRKTSRELKSAPVSFLQRIEKELQPRQLTDWIHEGARKFFPTKRKSKRRR